jgi:hypothetical protein
MARYPVTTHAVLRYLTRILMLDGRAAKARLREAGTRRPREWQVVCELLAGANLTLADVQQAILPEGKLFLLGLDKIQRPFGVLRVNSSEVFGRQVVTVLPRDHGRMRGDVGRARRRRAQTRVWLNEWDEIEEALSRNVRGGA